MRLQSLTGLRFVAALAVFAFHLHTVGLPGIPGGSAGVGFFFLLSGFVLTWSAQPGRARDVWRRRLARVVPSHVVAWIAALVLVSGFTARDLPSLFLVQAWVPDERVFFAVNTPAWSLSCEVAFYLAFPFLLPLVQKVRPWPTVVVLLAVVAVAPLGGYWFAWVFPPTRAAEFMLGMILARLVQEGLRIPLWPSIAFAGVMVWVGPMIGTWGDYSGATVVPFAMVIVAASVADLDETISIWRHPIMVKLGEWSFGFYLVHHIVIRAVDHVWHSPAAIPFMLGGSLLGAYLLHNLVEKPGVRLLTGARVAAVQR